MKNKISKIIFNEIKKRVNENPIEIIIEYCDKNGYDYEEIGNELKKDKKFIEFLSSYLKLEKNEGQLDEWV